MLPRGGMRGVKRGKYLWDNDLRQLHGHDAVAWGVVIWYKARA